MTKRLAAAFCACVVLASAGAVMAASYTDKATGNYNTAATWNEGGNPGGGTIADTVTITNFTVTMTVAGDGSNDTVIVNTGGTLKGLAGPTGLFRGSAINLNGGIALLQWNYGGYWDGLFRAIADSEIQARGGNRGLGWIDTLELLDGVTLRVDQNDAYLGAYKLLVSGGATIEVIATGLSFPMRAVSIGGTGTLTKIGSTEALTFTGPAVDFSGGLIVGEGYVYANVADAFLGASTITVRSNATLQSDAAYALNGCTIDVIPGGVVKFSSVTDAFGGSTSVLHGGTAYLSGGPGGADPSGTIRVYTNSSILTRGGNILLCEIDDLQLMEGAYLSVDMGDQRLGVDGTMLVAGNSTLDVFATSFFGPMEVDTMHNIAARSLTKKGNEKLTLDEIMGIRLTGSADLISTNSFITITNAAGTITDNTTWEDATMWTKGGSAATAITATLNPGANKGTIDNAHGSVSFASSDLGYVTVAGLKSGGGANARLVIMEFDSPSDLDGIRAELETAHPDWVKFFQKGSNKIGFTLTPAVDGTGYFGWDNKHGDLGANVLGIWFGPPDRGTVIQVL